MGLHYVDVLCCKPRFKRNDDSFHSWLLAYDFMGVFQKWLKENAKRIFTQRTAYWADIMQTRYRSVSVSSARSRWGSCTADNALRYTFRLLYADKSLIDYVVVHELAHTKHKNHSPRFLAEV